MVATIGALVAALEHACAIEAAMLDELRAGGVEVLPHVLPEMGFMPTAPLGAERTSPQARAWFARAQQLGYFQSASSLADLRERR
jgi:hypothetical protein